MKSQFGTRHRAVCRHSQSRWTGWFCAPVCVAALALCILRPACATEGGGSAYPYGLNTVATGILPKPGHYLYVYNSYYTAKETTTNDGEVAPLPFDVNVRAHTLRYLRRASHPAKVFGSSVGWLIAQPFLIGDAAIGPREGYDTGPGRCGPGVDVGRHPTDAGIRWSASTCTYPMVRTRQGPVVQPGPELLGIHV